MDALIYIGSIVGGIFLFLIISVIVRAPGMALSKKFVKLGNLQGKSYDEIVAACSNPNSVSAAQGGKLCQWMATGYHIALLFDADNKCLGITHNTSV